MEVAREETVRANSRPTGGEITNPATGRLWVQTAERLPRLFGGDARAEGMVLRLIADRHEAAGGWTPTDTESNTKTRTCGNVYGR